MKRVLGAVVILVGSVIGVDVTSVHRFLPSSSFLTDMVWLFVALCICGVGVGLWTGKLTANGR